MTTTPSRPFIAAMQVTLDGYILGPEGESDWVDSWADGLELLPRGLVPVQNWRGGWQNVPVTPPGPVYVLGAVARKT